MRTRGQRGRSKATLDLIDTCIKIIESVQPVSVRGVCYKLFAAGVIDSMAKANTNKVGRVLRQAREEGLIPWEWIADESRQMEGGGGFRDLRQYARTVELSYRRDFWSHQPQRVIVISEKATVSGLLRPVLDEYGVPYFASHGFNSSTHVHNMAQEVDNDDREYVFLYVGDYDPSGMYMSEVDLPQRLERYGAVNFNFERIALLKVDTA